MSLRAPCPRFARAASLLLIASVLPASVLAWDPGGTRATFQPGTQSNPLVLPSGTIVYSDSEGVGIWVSMALPVVDFWAPPVIRYVSQSVSQAGGIAHAPRAVDFLDHSVLIAWSHDHDGRDDADVFVRRIGPYGPDPSFGQDGVLVCGADSAQTDPCVIGDGADGFYVAWSDRRNAGAGADIYIQRFDQHGGIRKAWPADGVLLCGASGDQLEPALFADSSGGAVAVWRDLRSGDSDLYAKGIDSTGASSPAWGADGLPICVAEGEQDRHVDPPNYVRAVYPNPTRGSFFVRAWVPEDRSVVIDVYDVQGRRRATRSTGRLPGGTVTEIPISMGGLPTGVYFLRYRLEGASPDIAFGTKQVVLIR